MLEMELDWSRYIGRMLVLVALLDGYRSSYAPRLRTLCPAAVGVLLLLLCGGRLVGVASALPDGRAWEMVSPLDKNGGDIRGLNGISEGGVVQASPDGQRITYVSLASFGEPQGTAIGSQYASERSMGGWLTQNVSTPLNAQVYKIGTAGTPFQAFSPYLSSALVFGGNRGRGGGKVRPVESPPLSAEAPAGYEDYYLEGIPGGAMRSLLTRAPGVPPEVVLPEAFSLKFLGATPDLSHIVLESSAALGASVIGEAGEYTHLYEWGAASEQFSLVSVLTNGAPESTHSVELGGDSGARSQAISEDGSRVIWTTGGGELYVREHVGQSQSPVDGAGNCIVPADACTLRADAGALEPNGEPEHGARFLTASSDGSKVFFADEERLTGDSTASGELGDLYRFEPDAVGGSRLVDLTVDHVDVNGAEVQGVLGASADGSYLYFVANGVLSEAANAQGEKATPGSCHRGGSPPGAVCNLYLWHEGWERPKFIATLAGDDEHPSMRRGGLGVAHDWEALSGLRTVRVSRDGLQVVFMSRRSLTGYDNTVNGGSCGVDVTGNPLPAQCEEVFLYEGSPGEADMGHLSCVSCNPSGARPIGGSGIPGGTAFGLNQADYRSRILPEAASIGRVFFDSADALVPQDTNGVEDVYEYENGHAYLLSDGVSVEGASFVDASANGNDVFFVTRGQLVSQDSDQLVDLYDARAPHEVGEGVGFPAPQAVVCEGEGCRSSGAVAPVFGAPSSGTFMGPGNALPAVSAQAVAKKHKLVKHRSRKRGKRRVKVVGRARAGVKRIARGGR